MRTICQDTGSFARSPHFHLFNKQSLFQGGVCCVCLCGQDSGYVLTALPTELHRPRGRRWDSNPRQVNLHNAFAVGAFERGGPPCRLRGMGGLRVGGMTRRIQDAGALQPWQLTDLKSDARSICLLCASFRRLAEDGADEIKTPLCRTYVPVVRAYGTNSLGFLTRAVAGCVFCSPTVGTRLALVFRKPAVARRQPDRAGRAGKRRISGLLSEPLRWGPPGSFRRADGLRVIGTGGDGGQDSLFCCSTFELLRLSEDLNPKHAYCIAA